MLKFASIFALITLLIAVSIINNHDDDTVVAAKSFVLNQEVAVEMQPFPIRIEEQTFFQLSFSNGLSATELEINAWIEGINMYMGKNQANIELDPETGKLQGWFFLGSCSEPIMQWRFYLKLKRENGEKQTLSFDFFTEM